MFRADPDPGGGSRKVSFVNSHVVSLLNAFGGEMVEIECMWSKVLRMTDEW